MDTIFHANLPFDIDSCQKLVVRVCYEDSEASSNWLSFEVWLRRIPNSTLWVSDSVRIPVNLDIEYEYCQFVSESEFGYSPNIKTNRRGNLYDRLNIFKRNHTSNEKDYTFVDYIYMSIKSPDDLKSGIMDYKYILKKYSTEYTKITDFITQCLETSRTKEQTLFLCVLLGCYIDKPSFWFCKASLPDGFPSHIMIEEFKNVCDNSSPMPSDAKLVVKAINALVQYNSKHRLPNWITMFALAPKFDASYSFIDSIEVYDYKETPEHFIKLVKEVKLNINGLKNANELNTIIDMLTKVSYDAKCLVLLWEHFKELENDSNFLSKIRSNFPSKIRSKLWELIKRKESDWNDENIDSLHKLLKDSGLKWQHKDYANILESIVGSDQVNVLESFPEIFEYISGLKLYAIKRKLEQESKKWFLKIYNQKKPVSKVQESSAYNVFCHLSTMYSTSIFGGREILKNLMNRDINRLLSDESVFAITSHVDVFHQDIITYVISLVKERLRPLVQDPDERLLEKIMQICDSKSNLNVRSCSCEEILCFILSHLQQAKNSKFPDTDSTESFQLSLFQFAKFWTTIFRAEGHTQKLRSHSYFKEVHEIVIRIATNIKNNTITIRLFQKIFISFVNNDKILKDYINSAIENCPEHVVITDEDIEKSRNQCHKYNLTLERLQKFYERFCPSQLVSDVQLYFNDLSERSIDITLKESYTEVHWSMHSVSIEIMKDYYDLVSSQTFYNVFQILLEQKSAIEIMGNPHYYISKRIIQTLVGQKLTVRQLINRIIRKAITNYKIICEAYDKWEEVKCAVADEFWKNVNEEHVDDEINVMIPYFYKLKSNSNPDNVSGTTTYNAQGLISSVKLLVNISSTLERLRQLVIVIKRLDIIPHDQDFWVEELINKLEDKELLLGQLCEIFDRLNEIEKMINYDWSTIKEISSTIDFVVFLKSLVGHDLKHLINGVDDHSDERLIKENIVQKFIQVKQILEPLIEERNNEHSAVQEFLQILLNIVNMNPSLISALRLCNANAQALKIIYRNISNRGEMTKEKIFYSVTKGVYLFKRMEDDESKYTATLSYSSDILRDSIANYTFDDLQSLRSRALLIINTKAFTNEKTSDDKSVKTNEITSAHMNEFVIRVDLAQEIIDVASSLKELGHFKYRDFQTSTHTTQDMEILLKILLDDLQNWETNFNKAQQNHYYLTFFLGQHILNFYDYFSCNENIATTRSNIKERCSMLLRYVNGKAKLPNIDSDILKISLESKNYYAILCKIDTILHEIFSQIHIMQRQMTAIVEHDTAYMVHRGNLFVAKCNDKFRYQLVSNLRSLCQREKQFYLALICCLENSIHHHILDQFSENIHAIQGFDANYMHNIYKELCPNVLVVSSDLSGQGKTKWIEEQNLIRGSTPRKFLISDGMTVGMIIRTLSEIRLKSDEILHLNIMLIDNHYDLNMFLFELLSFKFVMDKPDFLSIPSTLMYIEVESTINQDLLNTIPIIGHLEKRHLAWNIDNIIIPQDVNSSIQIVARYLDAHDLDTINKVDIDLDDKKQLIPETRCRQLLQKYFFDNITQDIMTYRFLEIFVNILADQLKRMSSSTFFRVDTLEWIAGNRTTLLVSLLSSFRRNDIKNIRKTLLETLIEVSMDIATRSVNSKKDQVKNLSNEKYEDLVITTIKPWEDSNHLLVFFLSQSPDSICALYRDRNKVPKNVKDLLQSQHFPATSNFELDSYDNMSPEDILKILESLARTTHERREYAQNSYVLSADNLLKMALILLRSRANVPVVICGEAGCGKTSLIQFLSDVVNVEFRILNLHAGVTKQQILSFLFEAEMLAEKSEIWLFFDEINTCNHIGILADLIAHRLLLGKKIHSNIRLFAACNPYRFRQKADTQAGLRIDRYEEKSHLAYQVRPLPDQILDYVWDYGILKPSDEKIYINMLVKKSQEGSLKADLFTELLTASQEFIRDHEGVHSVSLRDVKRAIIIFEFCFKSLNERQKISEEQNDLKPQIFCLRNRYRDKMCEIFKKIECEVEINSEIFMKIVHEEQKDFMKRMTKPNMVAENFALLENVLVITVCILTRIPLFIVGAPGASKSLAVRLVSQSLRGKDSDDPYFRTLPQVYLFPHQGSSSSTSDGIIKVFDKAKNYQKGNSEEFPLITVVLLDEIGLAEKSPHNPLKVLHSLLEPNFPAGCPEVAIIGISNWRLDNSKSSRALLVQRPNLEREDLIYTTKLLLGKSTESQFKALAESYLEYKRVQSVNNFHGLRDYYSLVKSLGGGELAPIALARNFGGTNQINELYETHFKKVITAFNCSVDGLNNYSIEDLIKANLKDKNARHLMIIGKSSSIVDILTYKLKQWNKEFVDEVSKSDDDYFDLEPVVIYGSQFPDDFDGDYQYSVLSRIMMCVEAGIPLILTDLNTIYGSLYDLWNQNYIAVGKEGDQPFYTRVALGAYSNPMVCVHKNFRCILVLDEKDVNYSDPPLLNRFEKQKMAINEMIIDNVMKRLLNELAKWSEQISTLLNLEGDTTNFNENDIFIGFDKEETLQSLVICNSNDSELDYANILRKCKEQLIGIALPDGIVRTKNAMLSSEDIEYWHKVYFQQYHEDFPGYIRSLLKDAKKAQGFNTIVYTFSNINTDIKSCLNNILKCQVDKLSTFKSEAQFRSRVKHFWLESEDNILILQCDLDTANSECIKLAKFIIEQYKIEFVKSRYTVMHIKHVCIILHLRKENTTFTISPFNFMCGWDLFAIETLIPQENSLLAYLDEDLITVLEMTYTFEKVIDHELLWCLLCIEFPPSYESADYIRTFEWLHDNDKQFKNWQLEVAVNKRDLYLYSSFSIALQMYIRHQVRKPVAQLLFALEKLSGLLILDSDNLFNEKNKSDNENCNEDNSSNLFAFWEPILMNTKIVNTKNLKMPYKIKNEFPGLKLPFSRYFMEQINKFKNIYQDDLMALQRIPDNIDEETGNIKLHIIDDCIQRFSEHIISVVPVLKLPQFKLQNAYFNDFVTFNSYGKTDNSQILRQVISFHMKQEVPDPVRLHIFWWDNEDLILTELQLVLSFPSIVEEILNTKLDENRGFNLENYLLNRESDIMVNKLYDIIGNNCKKNINEHNLDEKKNESNKEKNRSGKHSNDNDEDDSTKLQHWQRDIANLLPIFYNLPNSLDNPSLNMLRVYYDLSKSIHLAQLLQIRQYITDPFSKQSIDIVFEMFDQTEEAEINLYSRRSFISRCLNAISLGSPVRSHLYRKIFSQKPLTFTFHTIYLIFESENRAQKESLFFDLINSSEALKNTKRLQVIENVLSKQKGSEIAALCCDVIQIQLSAKYQFKELSEYFLKAIDILISNSKALQKIIAIALLKVFANEFWSCTESIKNFLTTPIKFKFANDNINIDDLNKHLRIAHPLIYSFTMYLLNSLYLKGLTTYELKQFCDAQQKTLPWVGILKTNCDSRLGFNPYWCFEQFKQIDILFKTISARSDESSVNDILNMITKNDDIIQKISLVGVIVSKFYLIRASRELNPDENILIEKISKCLRSAQLPESYKIHLLNFMANEHQLYNLSPNVNNSDVFISSVVAHVVALHISSAVDTSPLTAYMQTLYDYKDTYILTCPSDEMALVTNVIIKNDSGTRRYQCECGNVYFIGDCGNPFQIGECNQCKNKIGGSFHILRDRNNSIDKYKIKQPIAVNDKQGYIIEDIFDTYHSVRTLQPASYRILHLFLHIIIGVQAYLPTTAAFINNQDCNIAQYCKKHIENDWEALKSIFNCENETLALFIHATLLDMTQESSQNVEKFTLPAQRDNWEKYFSQRYVLPSIKNFVGTVNNFRIKLDENTKNSLEINETMKITDQYNEKYLPLLWRLITKPNLDNFRSYYMSDTKNKELFPLLNIFLKHEKYLNLIQHLLPIVKFIQILSSSLSYNIDRQKARQLTFQQFIENESEDDNTGKIKEFLNAAFNNFANSWNCLIPHIKRYRCENLSQQMPKMHNKIPIVYGLYVHEPTDESSYICATIEFLVQSQNNFLHDIIEIPSRACQSLKFAEKPDAQTNEQEYHLPSVYLEDAKSEQIINYDICEIFLYCQHDLRLGHGREIYYDLFKIEAELAIKLVYGKKLIETNKDQIYLNAFMYHKELFSRSVTILKEIKALVHQEPIPVNNKPEILTNQMELLSILEIVICFLKQASGGDCDTLISDYIAKWMKLSVIKKNFSYEFLIKTGLQLKHIVELYELVEEHVADIIVNCIPLKYQAKLNESLKQVIIETIDFKTKISPGSTKIPAKAFMTALKRFIIRYLLNNSEAIQENFSLSLYLGDDDFLGCWPNYVSMDIIQTKFPTTLLTSHIYNIYQLLKRKIFQDQKNQTIND
ncbi:2405_t:CDS:10 [Cetraspora pellucida]|uniref:2405_t:CDS:1 n=1 Tax=Cetraspora pellucida TaxID=1433469 RepID=A0A9N8WQB9_9GLOM|nr:2405_t:CDS:10 [Cetraspora pellucida]